MPSTQDYLDRRWTALILLCVAQFVVVLDASIVNVALPSIGKGLDFSEENLWQYNLDFVNHYGNKTAGLEAFRMYLQTLSNPEINYGMRHFLSAREATEISLGELPQLSPFEKIVKLFRGLGSYKAFRGLVYTMNQMRTLNNLYLNYPKTPSEFTAWKQRVDSILHDVRARFN